MLQSLQAVLKWKALGPGLHNSAFYGFSQVDCEKLSEKWGFTIQILLLKINQPAIHHHFFCALEQLYEQPLCYTDYTPFIDNSQVEGKNKFFSSQFLLILKSTNHS